MEKTGIELIVAERQEQIEKHNKTVEYDVKHNAGEQLSYAAEALITDDVHCEWSAPYGWHPETWNKMKVKPYKERLIMAGALIAAEIDRLQAVNKLVDHSKR
jgi:hypothetical protein